MAPRSTKPEKDGAKPGAGTKTPKDRAGYDAAEQATKREAAPYPIGGTVYHRRRKNWTVTRELRNLMRKQERAQLSVIRANKEIEELPTEAEESAIEAIEDRIDELMDGADEATYEMVALLLRDDEGKAPAIDLLQEELDVEDVRNLAQTLGGGGQPTDGPTQTESS